MTMHVSQFGEVILYVGLCVREHNQQHQLAVSEACWAFIQTSEKKHPAWGRHSALHRNLSPSDESMGFHTGLNQEGTSVHGKTHTSSNMQSLIHKPGAHLLALIYIPQHRCDTQHKAIYAWTSANAIMLAGKTWPWRVIKCSEHLENDTFLRAA